MQASHSPYIGQSTNSIPSLPYLARFRCVLGLILLTAEGALATLLLVVVGALACSFFGARAFHRFVSAALRRATR
jgi:hypothetical protein